MIHQYDHRFANVTVNEENLHNAAFGATLSASQKEDPSVTRFRSIGCGRIDPGGQETFMGARFREIARATDARTMIAAIVPSTAAGNKLPLLLPSQESRATMLPSQRYC